MSHGSREWFWNTTARSGPGPSTSLPSSTTPPPVAGSSPATTFSSVDLPQPEWPMTETYSPRAIFRSMPFSTGTRERPKATVTWEMSRKVCGIMLPVLIWRARCRG